MVTDVVALSPREPEEIDDDWWKMLGVMDGMDRRPSVCDDGWIRVERGPWPRCSGWMGMMKRDADAGWDVMWVDDECDEQAETET